MISLLLGHYISDGMYPGMKLNAEDDRWLQFNDEQVKETTGAAIRQKRQRTSYILFYRQLSG